MQLSEYLCCDVVKWIPNNVNEFQRDFKSPLNFLQNMKVFGFE